MGPREGRDGQFSGKAFNTSRRELKKRGDGGAGGGSAEGYNRKGIKVAELPEVERWK